MTAMLDLIKWRLHLMLTQGKTIPYIFACTKRSPIPFLNKKQPTLFIKAEPITYIKLLWETLTPPLPCWLVHLYSKSVVEEILVYNSDVVFHASLIKKELYEYISRALAVQLLSKRS